MRGRCWPALGALALGLVVVVAACSGTADRGTSKSTVSDAFASDAGGGSAALRAELEKGPAAGGGANAPWD